MSLGPLAAWGRVLWLMSRPTHLLLIVLVYLVGAVMALALGARLDFPRLATGLLPLLLVSISIHYANEYADVETDARTIRTPFSGGSGALPGSSVPPRAALAVARIALALGLLTALLGLAIDRLHPAALGVLLAGAGLGWMYSLPPLALAWRGWGELTNAVAGGLALPLFGYAALAGRLTVPVVAACVPFVALVFLNMLATTWPDRAADAAVGKNTLAVLWPVKRLRALYWAVAAGYLLATPLLVGWSIPLVVACTSYLVAPLVVVEGIRYTRRRIPLAGVAAMVGMVYVQLMTWLSMLAQSTP